MDITSDTLFLITDIIISMGAFLFGAFKLFKNNTNIYFKFIICASGCFALEELSAFINYICGNVIYNGFQVSVLGSFGCMFFLLTAEYGVLAKKVKKDFSNNKLINKVSLIAPISLIALNIYLIFTFMDTEYFSAAIFTLFLSLPAIFTSYFNLKHLLISRNKNNYLYSIKYTDILSLIFYLLFILYLYIFFKCGHTQISIAMILTSLDMTGLVIASLWGDKKWRT